jgi:hypothetical protein
MNNATDMTNRDKVRKVLGITGLVLIVGGPYVASDDYQANSRSRRGQNAEEWFAGLQAMLGDAGSSSGTAIVIGWLLVLAGVGCLVGWFLLGRKPAAPPAQAQNYAPQAQGHAGAPPQGYPAPRPPQPMPPTQTKAEPGLENTFDNPFNAGQPGGGDRR